MPPLEMRIAVGPIDPVHYDNPSGGPVLPLVPDLGAYRSVFDFGCGCGRLARRLIQQRPPPMRYVGIDLDRGMIDWCRENLAPDASGFEFLHHDVFHRVINTTGKVPVAPFPVADAEYSLFIAWSVFTHLLEEHASFYLRECARILEPGGIALTTWFLFDKHDFPVLRDTQNALYIDPHNPESAVIFDRSWLRRSVAEAGLSIVDVMPPTSRGFQWTIFLRLASDGFAEAELPADTAPLGSWDELMDRRSRYLPVLDRPVDTNSVD